MVCQECGVVPLFVSGLRCGDILKSNNSPVPGVVPLFASGLRCGVDYCGADGELGTASSRSS